MKHHIIITSNKKIGDKNSITISSFLSSPDGRILLSMAMIKQINKNRLNDNNKF